MGNDTAVHHPARVPPVPQLVQVSVGAHPATAATRGFDRLAFTFTQAFPSSNFWFSSTLLTVGKGDVVPRPAGTVWLGISFMVAQAHTEAGVSSIVSQPPAHVGGRRIISFVQAGDFEGGVNYGIAVTSPGGISTHQPVRVVEVETVNALGQHRYTVAFDFPVNI
jgi:hypothetical protein